MVVEVRVHLSNLVVLVLYVSGFGIHLVCSISDFVTGDLMPPGLRYHLKIIGNLSLQAL